MVPKRGGLEEDPTPERSGESNARQQLPASSRGSLLDVPGIQLAPLEPAIAVRSTKVPGEFHPDPADRIIVATALENAVPIITPDDRIRSYPHVQSAW